MSAETVRFENLLALSGEKLDDLRQAVAEVGGHVLVLIHLFYVPEFDAFELGSSELRRTQTKFGIETMASVNYPVLFFESGWRFDRYARQRVEEGLTRLDAERVVYFVKTEAEDPVPEQPAEISEEERWAVIVSVLSSVGVVSMDLLGRVWVKSENVGCVAVAAMRLHQFQPRVMEESDLDFFKDDRCEVC